MDVILRIITNLKDTPVPTVLIILGSIGLVLPLIEIEKIRVSNKFVLSTLSLVMLGSGILLYSFPLAIPQISKDSGLLPTAQSIAIQSDSNDSSRVLLGAWEYRGNRPVMPSSAGDGQVIFANGDIDNSGFCHIKEFGNGEVVEGLGDGTFLLWLITGTLEEVAAHEQIIQEGAAKAAPLGICPYLPEE